MSVVWQWHSANQFPRKYCSQPVVMNENEFIVAMDVTYGEHSVAGDGIYAYYIKKNEWHLLIEYPSGYSVTCPSICYDFNTGLLYVYGGNKSLLIANLNTKQCIVKTNLYMAGWYPKSIMIDNEYNLICGEDNKHHLIWDNKLESFKQLHTFDGLLCGNSNPGVVHFKSKNMIVLFGGVDVGRGLVHQNLDEIWVYTLHDKTWQKLNIKLPCPTDIFGYSASTDDRYIFIVGGRSYSSQYKTIEHNCIYVIDTKEWKIIKSMVTCPEKGQFHACIVPMTPSNNYLASGYIRKLDKLCNLVYMHIPMEIIDLISSMYYEDYLHILKLNNHWKININYVIDNTCT
eukprot:335220_1